MQFLKKNRKPALLGLLVLIAVLAVPPLLSKAKTHQINRQFEAYTTRARGRRWRPRSMYSMGPPRKAPSFPRRR